VSYRDKVVNRGGVQLKPKSKTKKTFKSLKKNFKNLKTYQNVFKTLGFLQPCLQ